MLLPLPQEKRHEFVFRIAGCCLPGCKDKAFRGQHFFEQVCNFSKIVTLIPFMCTATIIDLS